jgi:predicted ferric reductase
VVHPEILHDEVVQLSWPRADFAYLAGQFAFVCVPRISLFEWHPFSFSSHPDHDHVVMHIRVLGKWTKRLAEIVGGKVSCLDRLLGAGGAGRVNLVEGQTVCGVLP